MIPVAMVTSIQITIAVLGKFRGGRLETYVPCLDMSIGHSLEEAGVDTSNISLQLLPDNFTNYPVI